MDFAVSMRTTQFRKNNFFGDISLLLDFKIKN